MNASSPEIQWFIARDGKQYGPVSDIEMRKLVELGHMRPGDLVWRPGFPDWRPSAAVFAGPAGAPPRPQTQPSAPQHTAPNPAPQASGPKPGYPQAQPAHQPAAQPKGYAPGGQQPGQPTAGHMAGAPRPSAGPGGPGPAGGGGGAAPAGQWPNMGPATGRPGAGIPISPLPASPARQPTTHGGPAPGSSGMGRNPAGGMGSAMGPGSMGPGSMNQGGTPQAGLGQGGMGAMGRAPAGQHAFQPIPTGGATQPTHASHARPTQPGALQPISQTSDFEEEPAPPRRRRGGRLFAIAVVVLALAATGGFVMSKGGIEPAMKALGALAGRSPDTAKPSTAVVTAPATAAKAPVADAGSKLSDAEISAGADALDGRMQHAAVWALVKKDYPDWYAARIKEGGKLVAEKKPDQVVTKYLVEQLVSLRRQHADQALGASTPKLMAVASAFLANLKSLAAHSTEACYSFISQGETSPAVIQLMSSPGQNAPIETQVLTIFQAIAEGKAARAAHSAPQKSDYDVLADQLAKIGWSQGDLQLFADPKALARSEPAKVCKMVQDWFTAHLAIGDAAVQERLLVETLRPVVAG